MNHWGKWGTLFSDTPIYIYINIYTYNNLVLLEIWVHYFQTYPFLSHFCCWSASLLAIEGNFQLRSLRLWDTTRVCPRFFHLLDIIPTSCVAKICKQKSSADCELNCPQISCLSLFTSCWSMLDRYQLDEKSISACKISIVSPLTLSMV